MRTQRPSSGCAYPHPLAPSAERTRRLHSHIRQGRARRIVARPRRVLARVHRAAAKAVPQRRPAVLAQRLRPVRAQSGPPRPRAAALHKGLGLVATLWRVAGPAPCPDALRRHALAPTPQHAGPGVPRRRAARAAARPPRGARACSSMRWLRRKLWMASCTSSGGMLSWLSTALASCRPGSSVSGTTAVAPACARAHPRALAAPPGTSGAGRPALALARRAHGAGCGRPAGPRIATAGGSRGAAATRPGIPYTLYKPYIPTSSHPTPHTLHQRGAARAFSRLSPCITSCART